VPAQEVSVTDDQIAAWRRRFAGLLDPSASDPQRTEEVDSRLDKADLRNHLRVLFESNPHIDRVLVRVQGHDIGIAARARADRDPGHAGVSEPPFDPGSSDGATLPGHASQFEPVRFTCTEQGCGEKALRSFYDDRYLPACPQHGEAMTVPT
jgi:hypothetical protein